MKVLNTHVKSGSPYVATLWIFKNLLCTIFSKYLKLANSVLHVVRRCF